MVSWLDRLTRVLSQYSGRDKSLRTLHFILLLSANHLKDRAKGQHLLALAKQLSAARLVFRQFNLAAMINAAVQLTRASRTDFVDFLLQVAVTIAYTIFGVVELLAWLADAKLLSLDAARLFRYCLYLWLGALAAGMFRLLRNMTNKSDVQFDDEKLTFLGYVSDFISGFASLPFGVLWAGRLTSTQTTTLSLIASLIALYKCF
uniref:Glycosomal membrane protein n=1 Tax=Parascaris univalens TaxID=6257 RepID=A0A915B2U8_PARUN